MIITGAFFAEHARVSENKLDVLGGVWDQLTTKLGQPFTLNLVLLLQREHDSSDGPTPIEITVSDSSGEPAQLIDAEGRELSAMTGKLPAGFLNGENGFYWVPLNIAFSNEGRHAFVITVDGSSVTVPLRVTAA